MKKIYMMMLFCALLLLAAAPCTAFPWQMISGDQTIEKGQIITSDLLFRGDRLEINGEVKGDLIVWSGQVVVNGRIDGSIIGIVWDRLTIGGEVMGHVRVLASEMNVNGKVHGTITTAAASFNTGTNSLIGQGLLGIFSKVALQGTVNGPVDVTAMPLIQISGRINGPLKTQGAPVIWRAPLAIHGNVDDYSGINSDPSKTKGVSLSGRYLIHQPAATRGPASGLMTIFSIVWFIGSLLASLILFRFFPGTLWSITEPSRNNFRRSMFIGILTLIGLPIAILILVITMVGIPLAILLGLIYCILLLFFGVPVNLWLGRVLFRSRLHPSLMIILAGILQLVISFIPIINVATLLVFIILGMGLVIGHIRPQIQEKNKVDLKI